MELERYIFHTIQVRVQDMNGIKREERSSRSLGELVDHTLGKTRTGSPLFRNYTSTSMHVYVVIEGNVL